jgi:hypothetical protein
MKKTTISQPMANVQWYANTSTFGVGDNVFNYYANGSVRGISTIISAEYGTTNTSNYFLLSQSHGNSAHYTTGAYTMYNAGNTASYTVQNAGWSDRTATGTLNGISSNISFQCTGTPNSFQVGEQIYQISGNNDIFARAFVSDIIPQTSNTFSLKVNDVEGMFLTNFNIIGATLNGNISVSSAVFDLGVRQTTGTFVSLTGNHLKTEANNSLFDATVISIPFGSGASVDFDVDLLNTEEVELNTNLISNHTADLTRNQLNAASFGVLLNNANVNTALATALTFETKTLGTIDRLISANPGSSYSYNPFVVAEDSLVAPLNLSDFVLALNNSTGVLAIGERVTQATTSAKGIVKSANTTHVRVKRITFDDRWQIGTTTPYKIVGESSGFTADISAVNYDISIAAGLNAVIDTSVTTSNTAVATLKVTDSGFNYRNGQEVNFTSEDGTRSGTAIASVVTHGKAAGYYKSTAGFLSHDKYLYDGDYYQDFSYDIKSPISADRYVEMLKKILHVSGTKSFASILKSTVIDSSSSMVPDVIDPDA